MILDVPRRPCDPREGARSYANRGTRSPQCYREVTSRYFQRLEESSDPEIVENACFWTVLVILCYVRRSNSTASGASVR